MTLVLIPIQILSGELPQKLAQAKNLKQNILKLPIGKPK